MFSRQYGGRPAEAGNPAGAKRKAGREQARPRTRFRGPWPHSP